jgi:hypothetical protein
MERTTTLAACVLAIIAAMAWAMAATELREARRSLQTWEHIYEEDQRTIETQSAAIEALKRCLYESMDLTDSAQDRADFYEKISELEKAAVQKMMQNEMDKLQPKAAFDGR